MECLESFQTAWKLSGQFGKFPDELESFQMNWKVSRQPGNLPDSLENFLDCLESFRRVWKLTGESGQPGNFPVKLETCLFVAKMFLHVNVVKTICALFRCICRENYLCASSGKFLHEKVCHLENFDF